MAPGAAHERVVVQLGPGSPQDVLKQLFEGSKFDYILVGAPSNANALKSIILSVRGAGGASGPSVANNRPSYQPPQTAYQPPPDTSDENDAAEDDTQSIAAPEPASPEPPVVPPNTAQPYSNQPKTPEQLLQELQQMQQQQQQRPPREGAPQASPQD
jgi:hypothetical protein